MERTVALAALLLWLPLVADCVGAQADAASTEAALLSLRDACSNWEQATEALPGAPWAAGTQPCGSAPDSAWRGIQCSNGTVVAVQLTGLGLAGTLPSNLAGLADLQALNLSGNAFRGSIPVSWMRTDTFPALLDADLSSNRLSGTLPLMLMLLASQRINVSACNFTGALPAAWRSEELQLLDLSDNRLTGLLPSAWGEKTTLPSLGQLYLTGNDIRGPIPDPQWTSVGFAAPCTVHLRPGCTGVCGPLLPLSPQLYDPSILDNPLLNSSFVKPQQGLLSSITTLMATQEGLFDPDSQITITNTLGSCGVACPVVATNFYDVTWANNVTAADLLKLNPLSGAAKPGASLRLACYPAAEDTQTSLRLSPRYFGGDVAYLRFAGGNQRPGLRGLAGAMAASGVNDHAPNQNDGDPPYTGSMGGQNGTVRGELVQPVFLFVDLQSQFKVTAVVLSAGIADLRNASIYVGSDTLAVQRNRLVASGLNVAPNGTVAVPVGGVQGRYVIVYTGMVNEGQMSISDLQVYTAETNAAANKVVSVSGVAVTGAGALVDGDNRTCVPIVADSGSDTAWAAVDLGYRGNVGSVVLSLVPLAPPNGSDGAAPQLQVYVKPSGLNANLGNARACTLAGQPMPAGGGWAVVPCNLTGRVVLVTAPAAASLQLCELQVSLTTRPTPLADTSSSLSAGAIAGIVLGSLAAVAVLCLAAFLWARRRRRGRQSVAGAKGAAAAALAKQSSEACKVKDGLDEAERGDDASSGMPTSDAAASAAATAAAASAACVTTVGPMSEAAPTTGSSGTPVPSVPSAFASAESALPVPAGPGSPRSGAGSVPQHGSAGCSSGGEGGLSSSGIIREGSATDLSKLPPEFSDGRCRAMTASEFQLIRPLGEGSFGQVFLARYCETMVAVKMLTHQNVPSPTSSVQYATTLRNLYREASLMSRLRHPNVCQYLGACVDPPCLLMELCGRKSVDVVLAQGLTNAKVARQLSWGRLLSMALDSTKGMLYLHSRTPPIVHRDLKSANLLVDLQWHVRVADFNLSRETGSEHASSVVAITNPRWLAPEVLSGQPGQLPADVWAFGTVLWEIATWQLPFGDKTNPFQIITQVQTHQTSSGLPIPASEELPAGEFPGWPEYLALMESCWQRDPAARPNFELIVQRLRLLLSAELKRQQQLRQDGAGASVDVPVTPRSAPSYPDSPAPLSDAASMPQDGSASSLQAANTGSAVTLPGSIPLNLDATSPFAAASNKKLSVPPPAPPTRDAGAE
ncbi:hypothetical protein ABPG77_002685 [Micractinium sp. CCAP 211/92]